MPSASPAGVEFAVLATDTTVIAFTAKQPAIAAVRLTVASYANLDVSYDFPFDNLSNFTMTGTRLEQLTTALPFRFSATLFHQSLFAFSILYCRAIRRILQGLLLP